MHTTALLEQVRLLSGAWSSTSPCPTARMKGHARGIAEPGFPSGSATCCECGFARRGEPSTGGCLLCTHPAACAGKLFRPPDSPVGTCGGPFPVTKNSSLGETVYTLPNSTGPTRHRIRELARPCYLQDLCRLCYTVRPLELTCFVHKMGEMSQVGGIHVFSIESHTAQHVIPQRPQSFCFSFFKKQQQQKKLY